MEKGRFLQLIQSWYELRPWCEMDDHRSTVKRAQVEGLERGSRVTLIPLDRMRYCEDCQTIQDGAPVRTFRWSRGLADWVHRCDTCGLKQHPLTGAWVSAQDAAAAVDQEPAQGTGHAADQAGQHSPPASLLTAHNALDLPPK